ncbi:fusion protein SYT-SSX2, partial [Elysia marginata]
MLISNLQLESSNNREFYQQLLHRNLVYLANLADASTNVNTLLPAPGNQMPSGPIGQMRPPGQGHIA